MRGLPTHCSRLFTADDGVTASEYAVMLVLLVLAFVGAVTLLGVGVHNTFEITHATLNAAAPAEG